MQKHPAGLLHPEESGTVGPMYHGEMHSQQGIYTTQCRTKVDRSLRIQVIQTMASLKCCGQGGTTVVMGARRERWGAASPRQSEAWPWRLHNSPASLKSLHLKYMHNIWYFLHILGCCCCIYFSQTISILHLFIMQYKFVLLVMMTVKTKPSIHFRIYLSIYFESNFLVCPPLILMTACTYDGMDTTSLCKTWWLMLSQHDLTVFYKASCDVTDWLSCSTAAPANVQWVWGQVNMEESQWQ